MRAIKRLDQETRLRYVATFLGAHSIPSEYKSRRDEYVELLIDEMLPRVAEEKLAEFCDVFCEDKVFTNNETLKILSAARRHGLGLRIHADQLSLSGGAKLASELGAATADHLEHTDAEGIAALKSAGVQPVLLPGSVYALGSSRYPAARQMIDAGLAIVLATDFNPGSSPTPSMPLVLSIASTHMKMTPAEGITASTINAAYSLNRGDEIGSLELGKMADFVIHDAEDYREVSYFFGIEHPWRSLCRRTDGARATNVTQTVSLRLRWLQARCRLTTKQTNSLLYSQKPVDASALVFYYPPNTGKEVIQNI